MNDEAPTEWVVWCGVHKHYLKHVSSLGTTWTEDRAEAKGFTKKRAAMEAASEATWLTHNPTHWAISPRDGDGPETP